MAKGTDGRRLHGARLPLACALAVVLLTLAAGCGSEEPSDAPAR